MSSAGTAAGDQRRDPRSTGIVSGPGGTGTPDSTTPGGTSPPILLGFVGRNRYPRLRDCFNCHCH